MNPNDKHAHAALTRAYGEYIALASGTPDEVATTWINELRIFANAMAMGRDGGRDAEAHLSVEAHPLRTVIALAALGLVLVSTGSAVAGSAGIPMPPMPGTSGGDPKGSGGIPGPLLPGSGDGVPTPTPKPQGGGDG